MNKVLYAILPLVTLASCAGSYNIQGTSNVSSLDGQKLYLKVSHADTLKNIDSCDVVHGQFSFQGTLDTVRIAQIFMDDISFPFPIVLEEGNIMLKLDNTQQQVSGTPLNDKLNAFWTKFTQLRNQYVELDHEESAAILNGQDEETVNARLIKKALQVYAKGDKLFTQFVTDNFDNVLGPWGFITRYTYDTTPNAYPVWMNDYLYVNAVSQLPSWIEFVMTKATDAFKNNPQVKMLYTNYLQAQKEMSGMAEPAAPMAPVPGSMPDAPAAPPTPAEMAGDSVAD
ncbi:DUF4369 domain-containing protein [Prevotella dentasini]|uniref:DUF4369 domain-containing protein n=1 Tax=Prevotella dentasini TaxID=589537 RepID=UPI000468384F|nr:DUF4369 domain-containing protein [Prevotella dentasini]